MCCGWVKSTFSVQRAAKWLISHLKNENEKFLQRNYKLATSSWRGRDLWLEEESLWKWWSVLLKGLDDFFTNFFLLKNFFEHFDDSNCLRKNILRKKPLNFLNFDLSISRIFLGEPNKKSKNLERQEIEGKVKNP